MLGMLHTVGMKIVRQHQNAAAGMEKASFLSIERGRVCLHFPLRISYC